MLRACCPCSQAKVASAYDGTLSENCIAVSRSAGGASSQRHRSRRARHIASAGGTPARCRALPASFQQGAWFDVEDGLPDRTQVA